MSARSLFIWAGLIVSLACGCEKTPATPPPPAISKVAQTPITNPPSEAQAAPTTTTQDGNSPPAAQPKLNDAGGENNVAATAAENPDPKPQPLSPKEMLKLTGTGVVVIKVFDALGDNVGLGSGCIVDKGVVLTNYHVIAPAVTAQIQTRGTGNDLLGTPLDVIGIRAVDEMNDLAVLAVDGLREGLHQFSLAEPSQIEQYDKVFAIGHPDGLKFTTSTGFVNGLPKTSDLPEQLQAYLRNPETEWIQTDALIAGGSSGGPLLNEKGEIVGINTLRVGQRTGLAVRVKHVQDLLSKLVETPIPLPVPDSDVLTTRSVAEIKQGYDREFQQFMGDVQQLRMSGNLEKLRELVRKNNPGPACIQRCIQLIRKDRKQNENEDALKLCTYILSTNGGRMNSGRRYLDEFFEAAARDSELAPSSAKLISALNGLNYSNELDHYLRSVIAGKQADSVKASAAMVLITAMASEQDESLNAEMIELATSINQTYGEIQVRGAKIKDSLQPFFESQAFSIGSIAPDIIGKDSDEKELRLSDYRDKIVVLDFWADWCPHCRNMYPHERQMVERLKDKPFILLGINGDEPERARRVIRSGTVTWRSWLDGPSGPIGALYKIAAWPTTYVLDKEGRIRFKDLRNEELEAAVNSLLEDVSIMRPQDILAANSEWKFHQVDDAKDPGNWRDVEFDDSTWSHGAAPFGYEQAGTKLKRDEPGHRPLTTLFRKTFDLGGKEMPEKLLLNVRHRNGLVVFVNGKEVYRNQLTSNAGLDAGAIARTSNKDSSGFTIQLDSKLLKPTGNCIAAELHQFSSYSAQAHCELTLGTPPDLEALAKTATVGQQIEICRILCQVGILPGAAQLLETMQTNESLELKIEAAVAAAVNQLPVTAKLAEPDAQQSLAQEIIKLNEAAWDIVRRDDLTDFQYADALRKAKAAYHLLPLVNAPMKTSLEVVRNTYGVALYRARSYDESQEKLKESIVSKGDNPVDVAYLVLDSWRAGKIDEAKEQKKHLSKLLASEDWMHDTTALDAMREVENVVKE